MAKNKFHQGAQKGKDKFFKTPSKHNKQKQSGNSTPGSFFMKTPDQSNLSVDKNVNNKFDKKNSRREEQPDKNVEATSKTEIKKPFDKKKYRLKKYSNKYKVQQWEEKRKKAVLREYYRENPRKSNANRTYEEFEEEAEDADDQTIKETGGDDNTVYEKEAEPDVKNKKRFRKPHEEFQRVKEEKKKKQQDFQTKKIERDEARKKALKERVERSKKLSRKTKRGQPIMKYRMEMLLEKIQKSINQ